MGTKKLSIITAVLFILLTSVFLKAQEYQLTVQNGIGSGSYASGECVKITSRAPVTSEFSQWTGDIDYLDNPLKSQATIIMPDKDISLSAEFKSAPAGTYTILGHVSGATSTNLVVDLYNSSTRQYAYTASDASGNYSFSGIENGTYKISLQLSDIPYRSEPNFTYVTIDDANMGNIDFETFPSGGTVVGFVIGPDGVTRLSGIKVHTSEGGFGVTDNYGMFKIKTQSPDTDYTLTPESTKYTFTPATRTITSTKPTWGGIITRTNRFKAEKEDYSLTVICGTGGGFYTESTNIRVYAEIPEGKVFNKWSGDIQYLSDSALPAPILQMPAKNILIRAEFKDAASQTYAIIGRISGDEIGGVTVFADSTHIAITDKDGHYKIDGLPNGSYTISPKKKNCTFTPESVAKTVSDSNIMGVDFASAFSGYEISGKVFDSFGLGLANVDVSVNAGMSTVTDADGKFTLNGIPPGVHAIRCALSNFVFTPSEQIISITDKNVEEVLFIANPAYTLTVNNGTGSGTIQADYWHLIAPLLPPGKVFSGWTGDTQYLKNRDESLGIVIMPSKNITLTATFEDAPSATYNVSGILYGPLAANSILYIKMNDKTISTVTDNSGNFLLTGIENGNYSIKLKRDIYMEELLERIEVSDSDLSDLHLMYGGKTVSGQILDEYNNPVPGVLLSNSQGTHTATDANGQFSFLNISEPTTVVTPKSQNYVFSPSSTTVNVYNTHTYIKFTARKSPKHTLAVLNGEGSGRYAHNEKIRITADIPLGKKFDSWSGDTIYLEDEHSATTTVTIPNKDIVLIAEFQDPPAGTYAIKGKITGAIQTGVTIIVDDEHSTLTDISGNYTISGVDDGSSYTITPYCEGYTFSPASANVTIASANENGLNFTSTANASISGKLLDESGEPVEGVIFSVGFHSSTTDSNGNFEITGLNSGPHTISSSSPTYKIQPNNFKVTVKENSLDGLCFTAKKLYSLTVTHGIGSGNYPVGTKITIVPTLGNKTMFIQWQGDFQYIDKRQSSKATLTMPARDVVIDAFTADADDPNSYTISGNISGGPAQGVSVSLLKTSTYTKTYTTTDASGNYYFSDLANGAYTVSPAIPGYDSEPSGISLNISNADVQNQDFTLSFTGFNINASIYDNLSPSRLGITVSNGHGKVATTHYSGIFHFEHEAAGTYTLTPFKSGYTFTPTSAQITLTDKDLTHSNLFAAYPYEDRILTVIDGIGSGVYHLSETVSISANPPEGKIFTHWIGDVEYISDANAPKTTVKVPNKDLTIQAEFISTPQNTNTISGQIAGDILEGVTVLANGSHSGLTDSDGFYSITGIHNGDIWVAPQMPGYTFSPQNAYISVNGIDFDGLDFTSTFSGFSVSGKILDSTGTNGIEGVLVISEEGQSAVTNSNGLFTLTGLSNGKHIITPSIPTYSVIPAEIVVEIQNKNISGLLFNADKVYKLTVENGSGTGVYQPGKDAKIIAEIPNGMVFDQWTGGTVKAPNQSYTSLVMPDHDLTITAEFTPAAGGTHIITGSIAGNVKSSVEVILSGDKYLKTVTDENGGFFFSGLANGSYKVKLPYMQNVSTTPKEYEISIADADVNNINFFTLDNGYAISGKLNNNFPGVLIKIDELHYAFTNLLGEYKIDGLQKNKTYIVTPHLAGYTFTPPSRAVYTQDREINDINFNYENNVNYHLTVNNGSGSGSFRTGETVTIYAEVPSGYVFKQWTGDSTLLSSPSTSPATLTMPPKNITITAEFEAVPENTHSITGKISGPSEIIKGATIVLNSELSAFTDDNGNFTFSGLTNGSYNLLPIASGCAFSPASQTVEVNDADTDDVNFNISFTGYSISGTIIDNAGVPVPSITLTADSGESATTDINGKYSFTNLLNGYHTITPTLANSVFTPAITSLLVNNANLTNINFTVARTHSLTINNGTGSGDYKEGETIKIAPALPDGMIFTEWSGDTIYINDINENNPSLIMPGFDISLTAHFTNAPAGTHSISGTVTGDIVANLTLEIINYSLSTAQYTSTDSNGNYSFSGLVDGDYHIFIVWAPQKHTYISIPNENPVTVAGANIQNINFISKFTGFSISGYIVGNENTPLPGAVIYADATHLAVANKDGMFKILGLTNGSYQLTPSFNGFSFSPESTTITIKNNSINNIFFNAIPQKKYELTIINGIGSASYSEAESIEIIAETPDSMVFKEWNGDTFFVDNVNSPHATVTMPAKNIMLKALFEPAPENTHSIKGTVSGDIKQGVALTLDSGQATVSDASGNFSISGLPDGNYSITATLENYSLTPESKSVNIAGDNVENVDFLAVFNGYSISGTVLNQDGTGENGVSVSTDENTATTDALGNFTITGLSNGLHSLTAQKQDMLLEPKNQTVIIEKSSVKNIFFMAKHAYILTVNQGLGSGNYSYGDYIYISPITPQGMVFSAWTGDTENISSPTSPTPYIHILSPNINVTATFTPAAPGTYSITGTVKGESQKNEIISITNTSHNTQKTTTDENGNYSFSNLTNDTYTVSIVENPLISPYEHTPNRRSVTIADADVANVDFNFTFIGANVSGTILDEQEIPIPGVEISLDGVQTTTTDNNGYFKIIRITEGLHIVEPKLDDYNFSPAQKIVTYSNYFSSNLSASFTAQKIEHHSLIVNNGTGVGNYPKGEKITVTATIPSGQIFKEWTGDTLYLANSLAASTSILMPNEDIEITATFDTPPTYSISGRINGDVQQGVTISVDATHSTVTDANGLYTIDNLSDGSYTVTPTLAGYSFTPAQQSVTISGANRSGIEFTASVNTFTLTVENGTGSGPYPENESITISATTPAGKIFTNWSGDTSFIDDPNAASTTVTMPAQDITLTANFEDAPPHSYTISGTISGDAQQGVTISVDTTHSTVSLHDGSYSISGLANGTYTVTPTLDGYIFDPTEQTVTVSDGDMDDVDFTATASVIPVAVDDSYKIETGKTLTVNTNSGVLSNDLAPAGTTLTAELENDVTHGTLELNADGSFIYTPEHGFAGDDTFTYFADDGSTQSDTPATVTINVSIRKVTIGVTVTVLPGDIVDLPPGAQFDKVPKIYGVLDEKKIGMKKVKESTPQEIKAIWKKKIPLHDKIKTDYAGTVNTMIQGQEIQLKVKGKIDSDKIDNNAQKVLLVPPEITSYSLDGTSITIKGLFFGTKPPKIMLEPLADGKMSKCKVDKKSYSFDPTTGSSSVTAVFKSKKTPPGNYSLIIDNKIGIGVQIAPDGKQTIPVITINAPPAP